MSKFLIKKERRKMNRFLAHNSELLQHLSLFVPMASCRMGDWIVFLMALEFSSFLKDHASKNK
jgi:hypothetical protein